MTKYLSIFRIKKSISIASGCDGPDREGGCPGFDYYIICRNEVSRHG